MGGLGFVIILVCGITANASAAVLVREAQIIRVSPGQDTTSTTVKPQTSQGTIENASRTDVKGTTTITTSSNTMDTNRSTSRNEIPSTVSSSRDTPSTRNISTAVTTILTSPIPSTSEATATTNKTELPTSVRAETSTADHTAATTTTIWGTKERTNTTEVTNGTTDGTTKTTATTGGATKITATTGGTTKITATTGGATKITATTRETTQTIATTGGTTQITATTEGTKETTNETSTTLTNTTTEGFIGSVGTKPPSEELHVWVFVTIAVALAIIVMLSVVLIVLLLRLRRNKPDKPGDGEIATTGKDGIDTTNGRQSKVDTVDKNGLETALSNHDNVELLNETTVELDGVSLMDNVSTSIGNNASVHDKVDSVDTINIVEGTGAEVVHTQDQSLDSLEPPSGGTGVEVIALRNIKPRDDSNVEKCTSLYDIDPVSNSNDQDQSHNDSNVDTTIYDFLSSSPKTVPSRVSSFGKVQQDDISATAEIDTPVEKIKGSKNDIDAAIKEFNMKHNAENQKIENTGESQCPNTSPNLTKPSVLSALPKVNDSPRANQNKYEVPQIQSNGSKLPTVQINGVELTNKPQRDRKSSLDDALLSSNTAHQVNKTKQQRASSLGSVDGLTVNSLQSTISNLKKVESNSGKSGDDVTPEASDEHVYENRTVHLMVNAIETGLRNATNQRGDDNMSERDGKQSQDFVVKTNENEIDRVKQTKHKDPKTAEVQNETQPKNLPDNLNCSEKTTKDIIHPAKESKKGKKSKRDGSQSAFKNLYSIISKKLRGKPPIGKIEKIETGQPSQKYSYASGQTNAKSGDMSKKLIGDTATEKSETEQPSQEYSYVYGKANLQSELNGKAQTEKSETGEPSQEYSYAYGQTCVRPDGNVYTYADIPLPNDTPDDFYSEIPPLMNEMKQERISEAIYDTSDDKRVDQHDDVYSLEQTPNNSHSFQSNASESMNDVYTLETTTSEKSQIEQLKQLPKLETINEALNQSEEVESEALEMIDNDIYRGQSIVLENTQQIKPSDCSTGIKDIDPQKSSNIPDMCINEIYSGALPVDKISQNTICSKSSGETKNDDLEAIKTSPGAQNKTISDQSSLTPQPDISCPTSVVKQPERECKSQDNTPTRDTLTPGNTPDKLKNVSMIDNDLYSSLANNKMPDAVNSNEIDLVYNDIYERGPTTAL